MCRVFNCVEYAVRLLYCTVHPIAVPRVFNRIMFFPFLLPFFLRDRHRVDREIVAQEGHFDCPTRVFGGGGHVFVDDRRSNRGMYTNMYQHLNDAVSLCTFD